MHEDVLLGLLGVDLLVHLVAVVDEGEAEDRPQEQDDVLRIAVSEGP